MIELNGTKFYTPREVADAGLIVNRKNRGDYGFVLRLIKQGKLEARTFNEDSQIPYYMIPDTEIEKYNSRFMV